MNLFINLIYYQKQIKNWSVQYNVICNTALEKIENEFITTKTSNEHRHLKVLQSLHCDDISHDFDNLSIELKITKHDLIKQLLEVSNVTNQSVPSNPINLLQLKQFQSENHEILNRYHKKFSKYFTYRYVITSIILSETKYMKDQYLNWNIYGLLKYSELQKSCALSLSRYYHRILQTETNIFCFNFLTKIQKMISSIYNTSSNPSLLFVIRENDSSKQNELNIAFQGLCLFFKSNLAAMYISLADYLSEWTSFYHNYRLDTSIIDLVSTTMMVFACIKSLDQNILSKDYHGIMLNILEVIPYLFDLLQCKVHRNDLINDNIHKNIAELIFYIIHDVPSDIVTSLDFDSYDILIG